LVIFFTHFEGGKMNKVISSTINKNTSSKTNNAMAILFSTRIRPGLDTRSNGNVPSYLNRGNARRLCRVESTMLWRGARLAAGLSGVVLVLAAANQFWDQKDPQAWTPEECQSLLQNSPWAKPAGISFFNNSPGGDDFGLGGRAGAGLSNGRVTSRNGAKPGAAGQTQAATFQAVVRWGSSRPVRDALRTRTEEDASTYYIIELIGDVPTFGAPDDSNPAAVQQRVTMLRQYTKLDRKGGDPIYMDRVESIAAGTRFYFTRRDPITPNNKEVTFTTVLGTLVIKAKFNLKEMTYRGKLDL